MVRLCVTHEMGFARTVAGRVSFMDRGESVEAAPPQEYFFSPRSERARAFLSGYSLIRTLLPINPACLSAFPGSAQYEKQGAAA